MENKSKNTHHWRSLWLFVIALGLSGLLHLGWHMLAEQQVKNGTSKDFEVTVCLPPFCDAAESSGGRHMAARSTSEFPEPADFEDQSGLLTSLSHNHQFPHPDNHAGFTVSDPTHRVCVFDLVGTSGQHFSLMREWQRAALDGGGFRPALQAYTNRAMALEDFDAGKCDAAFIPADMDGMPLVPLASLSAFGAVTTRDQIKLLAEVLASEHPSVIRNYLVTGDYESMGLVFSGPAYLIVNGIANQASLGTLLEARNLAVSNSMQHRFASAFGAVSVPLAPETAAVRLNAGSIDGMLTPLLWIPLLELNRRQQSAGILHFPLYETAYALVSHKNAFSDEQKKWSREYVAISLLPLMESSIAAHQHALEKASPLKANYTMAANLSEVLRGHRIEQRDAGYYDGNILSLMRRIRCKLDSQQAECANSVE